MNKRFKHALIACGLGVFTLASFQPAYAKKKEEAFPECTKKIAIAVDRFKTENISVGWWNEDVALNSREVAVDELVQSGCFSVLERNEGSMMTEGLHNERVLARSGEARKGSKTAKKGQMKVADHLASFALTGASKDSEGMRIGGGGGAGGGFGGIGGGFKKSELTLACKVIDTASSEILASARVTAKDTGFDIGAAGGGVGAGKIGLGGIGYFKESKVGKMMAQAIHGCVVKLAKSVNAGN